MNYSESVAYLEEQQKFGVKLGLDTVRALLHRLGDPQKGLSILHVAGTNGKGSTSAFLSYILTAGGYEVGLYTSPALERFNERIQRNNQPVDDAMLAEKTTLLKNTVDKMVEEGEDAPSQFELETALAFLCFQEWKVDFVVLEVGMGGRLDATNVVSDPLVSVITSISLDHTRFLGNTLAEIASEKAGIIKEGCPVVLYPQQQEVMEVVKEKAREKGSQLVCPDFSKIGDWEKSLSGQSFTWTDEEGKPRRISLQVLGDYQLKNALMAFQTIQLLRKTGRLSLTEDQVLTGLKQARWKGRFEKISDHPVIILDGAHNPGGAEVFAQSIRDFLEDRPLTLVVGILADKKIDEMLDAFLPLASACITVTPDNPRAMPAEKLCERIEERGKKAKAANNLEEAWRMAGEETDPDKGAIAFVGSLYMIGRVRTYLLGEEKIHDEK